MVLTLFGVAVDLSSNSDPDVEEMPLNFRALLAYMLISSAVLIAEEAVQESTSEDSVFRLLSSLVSALVSSLVSAVSIFLTSNAGGAETPDVEGTAAAASFSSATAELSSSW